MKRIEKVAAAGSSSAVFKSDWNLEWRVDNLRTWRKPGIKDEDQ